MFRTSPLCSSRKWTRRYHTAVPYIRAVWPYTRRSVTTFAADVPLEDKFAAWKKEESSAAELFNSCLYVLLPIVKEKVRRHARETDTETLQ